MNSITNEPGVVELDYGEGAAVLDERVRARLGISGAEFLARFDAGTLDTDDPAVASLVFLVPFARPTTLEEMRSAGAGR